MALKDGRCAECEEVASDCYCNEVDYNCNQCGSPGECNCRACEDCGRHNCNCDEVYEAYLEEVLARQKLLREENKVG